MLVNSWDCYVYTSCSIVTRQARCKCINGCHRLPLLQDRLRLCRTASRKRRELLSRPTTKHLRRIPNQRDCFTKPIEYIAKNVSPTTQAVKGIRLNPPTLLGGTTAVVPCASGWRTGGCCSGGVCCCRRRCWWWHGSSQDPGAQDPRAQAFFHGRRHQRHEVFFFIAITASRPRCVTSLSSFFQPRR